MVVLFRTSYPPNTSRCNKIFVTVGKVIAVIVSLIVSVLYLLQKQQITVDKEFPIFEPDQIEYFSLVIRESGTIKTYEYPSGISLNPEFTPVLQVIKNTDTSGDVTSANIRIIISNIAKSKEIISFSVIFKYGVKLEKFAKSETTGYGVYTNTFPVGLERLSCEGELSLEQKEAADFRGSLPNDNIQDMSITNIENLIQATSNASSIYSIDWYDYVPEYNLKQVDTYDFQADLKVLVKEISIIHSKPLISFAFDIVVVFCSFYMLVSLVLSLVQHYFITLPHLESINRRKAFQKEN